MVITTAQLHSSKPELRFSAGSNQARGVSEIRDSQDLWQWSRLEIRLNAFRRLTMPQKPVNSIQIIFLHWKYLNLQGWSLNFRHVPEKFKDKVLDLSDFNQNIETSCKSKLKFWPNSQFPADLVTFTEEIFNGKLHFLCNVNVFFLDTEEYYSRRCKI